MSMFQTLSAGKTGTRSREPVRAGDDGAAEAGCNAASARTAATTSALPLMPRIIGIRSAVKLNATARC